MYMVDNDEQNRQSNEGSDLSHMVKENNDKICLLESGQKEVLTQLWLLAEKMGKQVVNHDEGKEEQLVEDEIEHNKAISNKAITHKEVEDMNAKARVDDAFEKKVHAPKYLIEIDLVHFST